MEKLYLDRAIVNKLLIIFYITAIIILTILRPIHQDDGWYASFAFNLINKIAATPLFSTWDYTIAGFEGLGSGFIYSLIQIPFIFVFGAGIIYTKILVIITTLGALYFMVRFLEKFMPTTAIYFPLLLLAWPGFWYHFYNRPEMSATLLGFLGLYLLAGLKPYNYKNVIFAFTLPVLMFDVHPISVFLVFGYYAWFFLVNENQRIPAILGVVIGLVIYLLGNWLANSSFGIFSGLFGYKIAKGDHYMPIFESNLMDILYIQAKRYWVFVKFFFASLLWLPLFIYYKQVCYYFCHSWFSLGLMILVFLLLSSLFTEAISNGFHLYATICFFIFLLMILEFTHHQSGQIKFKFIILFPLTASFLYFNASTYSKLSSYWTYHRYASNNYALLGNCMPRDSKALMRPTFSFAFAGANSYFDYSYNILYYMKINNLTFPDAIKHKDYDYIAIDEMDRRDMFSDTKTTPWRGNNPIYNAIEDISIDPGEFNQLISSGILIQSCTYDEISHGFTTFYRVDKEKLASYLSSGV